MQISGRKSEENMYFLIISIIFCGLLYRYRFGISGNDFWWHIKTGEWIVHNISVPKIGIFSWYAIEHNIEWVSQEWLADIILYGIHTYFHDIGVFLFSLSTAVGLSILIIKKNKQNILSNSLLSLLYLFPICLVFPTGFYGRPQVFSYFFLFATLTFLYEYKNNVNSRSIYFVPIIALFWSNIHGGSSNLSYLLCLLFVISGLFNFSFGKIIAEKYSKKQLITYSLIFIISLIALTINPHGIKIITYPYVNIGDSFSQSVVSEWRSPDAKNITDLIIYIYPLLIVSIILIATTKKLKFIDFMLFLFFSFLSLRSIRFSILFFIASTFFIFNYFWPRTVPSMKTEKDKFMFITIIVLFLSIIVYSIIIISKTHESNNLISTELSKEMITLVKRDSPERLYNDYNLGETLIYNDIPTFVDARADIFSAHNLHDSVSLLYTFESSSGQKNKIFDPEKLIDKYSFDAFLIKPERSLVSYLSSHPEKYVLISKDATAVYYKHRKH